ncbi:MAG: hypothetical protein KC708_16430, partial [Anaerolineae bacterium]|nr:hypothetical protein [Anaerolineae bacterium]
MVQFTQQLKLFIRTVSNIHLPGLDPNVFLFTTPRSGSTWLMEMIWSQPGFKYCNEPLNLRVPDVVRHLGITTWEGLYSEAARPKIETYFRGLIDGSIRFSNPSPLHKYYRPFTRRIIFKILNGQEDRISWFADTFNGRILFLLRHPIPVSLSRKQLPRLETFVKSEYKRHFTVKQLTSAERVIANGSNLERGVLSWCFQNAVPLRDRRPDWIVMTYEQTVLEPEVIIRHLARRLDLPNPECMLARVAVPSRSTNLSDV